jgi:hypothetical protein
VFKDSLFYLMFQKNCFRKKVVRFTQQNRGVFLLTPLYLNFMEKQFSFYDSEVLKLSMSGKTYWSEKPNLTVHKNSSEHSEPATFSLQVTPFAIWAIYPYIK